MVPNETGSFLVYATFEITKMCDEDDGDIAMSTQPTPDQGSRIACITGILDLLSLHVWRRPLKVASNIIICKKGCLMEKILLQVSINFVCWLRLLQDYKNLIEERHETIKDSVCPLSLT